jgi:hypothetical protein
MLRRLLVGLLLGLFVGGLVAAGLVEGLNVLRFSSGTGGAILAYLTAALTGVLTGLVAGKPIWASGAKIEAGLKAFFGALIAAGLMFALRQWAGAWTLDLPAIGAVGPTSVGDLPAASLPLLAGVLGGFFELDNTERSEADGKKAGPATGRQRVGANVAERGDGTTKARLGEHKPSEPDSEDDAEVVSKRVKR